MNSRRTLTYFHSGSELIVRAPHTRLARPSKNRSALMPSGLSTDCRSYVTFVDELGDAEHHLVRRCLVHAALDVAAGVDACGEAATAAASSVAGGAPGSGFAVGSTIAHPRVVQRARTWCRTGRGTAGPPRSRSPWAGRRSRCGTPCAPRSARSERRPPSSARRPATGRCPGTRRWRCRRSRPSARGRSRPSSTSSGSAGSPWSGAARQVPRRRWPVARSGTRSWPGRAAPRRRRWRRPPAPGRVEPDQRHLVRRVLGLHGTSPIARGCGSCQLEPGVDVGAVGPPRP